MRLGELIAGEAGVPLDAVMLLRHGNNSVAHIRRCGSTVEEFTAIQPINSKYDFIHPDLPRIAVVAVIADDEVHGVYRVDGVDAEGTFYELGSDAYKRFDTERMVNEPKRAVLRCRRFVLHPLASIATGLRVVGWEGRSRTPVQRQGSGFFDEIEVLPPPGASIERAIEASFEEQVADSLRLTRAARLQRLARAPAQPPRVEVTTFVFARNPDVVAEVLYRAGGKCEACHAPAPFERRTDRSPYLEVHHTTPLAAGGDDTVENAIALCPNCHRKAHYG
jgi:hypothetical protein